MLIYNFSKQDVSCVLFFMLMIMVFWIKNMLYIFFYYRMKIFRSVNKLVIIIICYIVFGMWKRYLFKYKFKLYGLIL